MRPRHLAISPAALTLTAAPVAGCGGSNGSDSAPGPHEAQQLDTCKAERVTASQVSRLVAAINPARTQCDHDRHFEFMPASLTVTRGKRITVGNHDATADTATADNGRSFDTGNIDPKSSATITLSRPGSHKYHCSIHPFMHGMLVVR